jgi:signal transduction histidine kinase
LQAKRSYDSPIIWNNIKGIIGGINDARTGYSFRMERNNGTIIECTLAPLPDGATLVTFIDVSASVHVERALKDKNDALEHAARLRENFVHHVSYQLRSPLTNVIGFTELLASGAAGLLTQKQSEYIDHVFESSKSLMAIIDDILDLASFDRGEIILELKKINIKQVINTAADALKDQLKERNLTLDIKISNNIDEFFLDEKRIQQILFNLLSNSIGFSLEGQSITIIAQLEKSKLNIVVKDNGRGIPEDVIESVFDRFETYTIGSRHRGAGLGLSIVRSLVELHGGTVTIESQPNKGTIVSCLFPPDCIETNKIEIA